VRFARFWFNPGAAMADIDIYLKLDGIPGDSTADRHAGEIVVLSYRTDIETKLGSHFGGGGGAGKAEFSGIQFRKRLDKASVPLLLACASGRHIASGQFTFARASADSKAFYTVTLEDVFVSHISQAVGGGGESVPTEEEVTLQCRRIHWAFSSQNPDGSQAPPITGGWDVRGNQLL
jgi:type VI secretion system secreted protein Hcp